jgi:hypothetical protein
MRCAAAAANRAERQDVACGGAPPCAARRTGVTRMGAGDRRKCRRQMEQEEKEEVEEKMWEMMHSEPHPAVRSESGSAGCYRSLRPEHASGVREAASRRALPYRKQKPPPLVLASG